MTFQQIKQLIDKWQLHKPTIAKEANINYYSFRRKLAEQPNYRFTDDDLNRITQVLKNLANDINKQ